MAKIICIKCEEYYFTSQEKCPHCQTCNFICHPDVKVMVKAVDVVIEQHRWLEKQERRDRFRELESLRPPTLPKRIWSIVKETLF